MSSTTRRPGVSPGPKPESARAAAGNASATRTARIVNVDGDGAAERDAAPSSPHGASFDEVWSRVKSDPYELPHHRVTLRSFFRGLSFGLLRAGRRTVEDDRDLLPYFDKLIRPNGICLAGTWSMTDASPYTGQFAVGTRSLIVARASVAFTETEKGHYRSFGMAGKIFPGLNKTRQHKTANFFVIDDNGGTRTAHYLDAEMSTRPGLSINPSALRHAPLLLAITLAQRLADRHSETRQLYPLSELGKAPSTEVRTPRFMMIKGTPGTRVHARDFRDELRTDVYDQALRFDVFARDDARGPWSRLGNIVFTDSVVSESGDHRLHFSHPRFRSEPRSGNRS